jgi:hypothetical protein
MPRTLMSCPGVGRSPANTAAIICESKSTAGSGASGPACAAQIAAKAAFVRTTNRRGSTMRLASPLAIV